MNMDKRYYYAIHVQVDEKYGYSVAVKSDEHLDYEFDEDKIISIAINNKLFEENTDYRLVDMVYEISEEEYNDFKAS